MIAVKRSILLSYHFVSIVPLSYISVSLDRSRKRKFAQTQVQVFTATLAATLIATHTAAALLILTVLDLLPCRFMANQGARDEFGKNEDEFAKWAVGWDAGDDAIYLAARRE